MSPRFSGPIEDWLARLSLKFIGLFGAANYCSRLSMPCIVWHPSVKLCQGLSKKKKNFAKAESEWTICPAVSRARHPVSEPLFTFTCPGETAL
jgi:hypothetical protein